MNPPRRRFLSAVGISLCLHGLVLLALEVWTDSAPETPDPPGRSVRITLSHGAGERPHDDGDRRPASGVGRARQSPPQPEQHEHSGSRDRTTVPGDAPARRDEEDPTRPGTENPDTDDAQPAARMARDEGAQAAGDGHPDTRSHRAGVPQETGRGEQPDRSASSAEGEKAEGADNAGEAVVEEGSDERLDTAGARAPRLAGPLQPSYPYRARRRGHEGTVVLTVTVAPSGSVVDVSLAQSSGYESLDRAAREAAETASYLPGSAAEPMPLRIRVVFELS